MRQQTRNENTAVEATLNRWRHKATNTLMIASALVYLPVTAIVLAGQGPALTGPITGVAVGIYGILLLETLLWRVDYRVRVGVNLATGYALALIVGIALPQGPFIRALPLILPLIATIFFGRRAGSIATGLSILILLFVPSLSTVPGLVGILVAEGQHVPGWPSFIWFQGIALTAILLQSMVLLNRFHEMLMQSLADRTAAYHKLKDEIQERRRLEHEVARITDEERRRLGNEIHDGICQQITAALLRSEALREWLNPADASATEAITGLTTLLEETIDEARAVAHGLCPLESDPEALAAALRTLAGRIQTASGIACALETVGDVCVVDVARANHFYRIAQEAASNAVRHSHAKKISMRLSGTDDSLLLEVEDDGVGLPADSNAKGMGLRTMSYRADLMEGRLTATTEAGGGTCIACRIPRTGLPLPEHQRQDVKEGP